MYSYFNHPNNVFMSYRIHFLYQLIILKYFYLLQSNH